MTGAYALGGLGNAKRGHRVSAAVAILHAVLFLPHTAAPSMPRADVFIVAVVWLGTSFCAL